MYHATRVASDYQVVLLTKGRGRNERHYCYHRHQHGWSPKAETEADAGRAEAAFKEISKPEAELYFSGQADGMGFGDGPEGPFATLQDAWTWVRSKQNELEGQKMADDVAHDRYRVIDLMMKLAPSTKAEFKERLGRHGLIDRWPEFEKRYEGKFKP